MRGGLGGERGDDIVGFVTGHRKLADAECVEHLVDEAELAAEIGGRFAAVRLVLDILLVPEGRLAAVERHRDMGGLLVPEHVDQHRGEPVDSVRWLTGGGGEVLGR